MDAIMLPIGEDGSCNFCKRGKLNGDTRKLEYPYTHILKVTGNSTSFNMCEDCMHDLQTNLEIKES